MSDVVLIYPSMDPGKKQIFGLPPLGILYIASVLKKEGIDVKVIDASIKGYTIEQTADIALKERPKIIGISASSLQVPEAFKLAKKIKTIDASIKLVLGGPHVNSVKDEIFKFTNDFDFLIYGEGEYSFLELYNKLNKDYSKIRGLIYKNKEKIKINPARELIKDLDALPFPDLNFVNIRDYKGLISSKRKRVGSIICSRGCPYNCSFCDIFHVFGRMHRRRSAKNIVDEMEFNYKNFKINEFSIKDSTFTVDKKRVTEICKEILNRGLDIKWSCNTRVDTVDGDLLRIMKKAGCYSISYGVESGSEKVLKDIKKDVTLKRIKEVFDLTRKAGLETIAFFMIGNLTENKETVEQSIKFANRLKPTFVLFSIATPYPNTEMYNIAVEKGYLKNKYWYMQTTSNWVNYHNIKGYMELKNLSSTQQVSLYKKANKKYYFRLSNILRLIKSIDTLPSIYRYFIAAKMSVKSWLK